VLAVDKHAVSAFDILAEYLQTESEPTQLSTSNQLRTLLTLSDLLMTQDYPIKIPRLSWTDWNLFVID